MTSEPLTDQAKDMVRLKEWRSIINLTFDPILIVDPSGTVLIANDEALRLFEYTETEFMGINIEMLMPERFRASHGKHMADYLVSKERRDMSIKAALVTRSGREIPVKIGLKAQVNEIGVFIGATIKPTN